MFKKITKDRFIGYDTDGFGGATELYEMYTEDVFVAPVVKKNVYASFCTVYVAGNIIEFIDTELPTYHGFEGVATGKKKSSNKKIDYNINRSKMALRRLINANVSNKDLFITLTYADNVTDVSIAKDDFKKFVKRWNYRRKKEGLSNLKYIYVIEFQKRGAVHFHAIFFQCGYISNSSLNCLWGKGHVKVNRIKNVDNVGAYVCKYMDKALLDNRLHSRDLYGRSKGNLNSPKKITSPQEVAILREKYIKYCTYSKSYKSDYTGLMNYMQCNLLRKNK